MTPHNIKRFFAILVVLSILLSMLACKNTESTDTESESESVHITEKESDSHTEDGADKETEGDQKTETASATESDGSTESAYITETVSEVEDETDEASSAESESVTVTATETDTESNSESESAAVTETDSESAPDSESESAAATEDGTESATEGESATEESTEQKCVHNYAATTEGHWKPACDICGKGEGSMQDHEIYEKIKDQGDRLAYLYLCSVCDFVVFKQELSYDINVYIPPTDLAATRCYNYTGTYHFEDNVGFTRFSSSGSQGIIYAYEDTSCEDVSGRYLVMKTRMSGGSAISLQVKSSMATSSISVTPSEIPNEWCTIIIDLAAIGNGKTTGYVPDGGGDYYLALLDIYLSGNTTLPAGGYLDISYITVVETMEDAREFAAKDDVLYIYDNVMMNPFPTIEGALCEHEYSYDKETHSMTACEKCGAEAVENENHTVVESVREGVYSYSCVCGYEYDVSKTVSSAVNTFLSPSYIAKHADNAACWSGGELIYEEGNEPFARIYGKDKDAGGKNITDEKRTWNVYSNGIAVTGQYLVIKYRVPNNSLKYIGDGTSNYTQSQIRIYTSTQRSGATDEKDGFYLPVSEDNEWHVAIINLAFSVGNSGGSTFVAAEDGTYTMKFMQLRLFYGGFSTASDYTDIAYIGFCDKLEEAVSLVEEDEYYWQCKKGARTGYTVDKSEGPDPSDEIPEVETEPEIEPVVEHAITETVKNGEYSYSCSHCENEIQSITVPDAVNKFYSPKYLSTVSGYNSIKNIAIDPDGTLFTRVTGNNGTAFEVELVNRSGNPVTDAGEFRYVVLRIRVSNASKHLNFVFQMENVDTSVRINNSMRSGEWTTLVLDMDKIAKITPNGDGGYKIKHCRFYTQDLGTDHVDFAYIAFCDDWSEVAPLAKDDIVTLVTHTSNEGGSVNAADGSCANHVPVESVSNGTYTYKCASCGETLFTKAVPSQTNLFISGASITSTYAATYAPMFEDGVVFQRFTTTASGAHIYVRQAATLADSGKYLVVKMRLSTETTAFVLGAGTNGLSTVEQNPPHNKGVWRTVVVDLAQFTKYATDTENGNVEIRFDIYGAAAGITLDVAYVAIVDDRAEARGIIDEESYYHYSSWKTTPITVQTSMETCAACLVTETVSGSTYSYSDCAICGRSFADVTKTVDTGVAKYYSAGQLASMGKYNASVSLMADASGEAFARIKSNSGGAYEYYIVNKDGTPATSVGASARYVTFKVRMTNIPLECKFSLKAAGGGSAVLYFSLSVTQRDEWVTVVADMDTISKLMPSDGGNIDISYFYMYTGSTGTEALDIAAVAFCNSWAEIAEISGSDTAMLMTVQNAKGSLVSTSDGSKITE